MALEGTIPFYTRWWNNLKLSTYKWGNLLDYGSLNGTKENGFIIDGSSYYNEEKGKYDLYRALTNAEKNQIIRAKREKILAAIETDQHYRAKMALFLFSAVFSLGVAFGSAAMMSHKFLDILYHYGISFSAVDGLLVIAPILAIVLLVNIIIYFISVNSVSRMLFGHGFLKGLQLKEEPKVKLNANNECELSKVDPAQKPLTKWQWFFQISGMFFAFVFALSLAVLTRVSSKGGLEDMMFSSVDAIGMSYFIGIATFIGMFALSSWAILTLVRVEDKRESFWQFCAGVVGIENASNVKTWNDFKNGFTWGHALTAVLVVGFALLCLYGLGSQGWAQSEALYGAVEKRTGIESPWLFDLVMGVSMASAILGKGAFVIKAIANTVGIFRNARSSEVNEKGEKLVVSPSSTLTLSNLWAKIAMFSLIFLNAVFQSTTAITAAVGIDGSERTASGAPSVDPIYGDPDAGEGKKGLSAAAEGALAGTAGTTALLLSGNSGGNGFFSQGSPEQKKTYQEESDKYNQSRVTF